MTIALSIADISRAYNVAPVFAADRTELDSVLSKLTSKIPPDLLEYLDSCIPLESYGDPDIAHFHSLEWLIKENRDYVPGADALEENMLCIAKDCSGNQYAYSLDDGGVYWLVLGDHPTIADRKKYPPSYDSLPCFLASVLADLKNRNDKDG